MFNRLFRRLPSYFLLTILAVAYSYGQSGLTTEPIQGIRQNTPRVHAFVNATIVVSPGVRIEKGTVVIRDGVIEAVGKDVTIPADARIWNYEGKILYPGFIDSYTHLGLPKAKKQNAGMTPVPFGGNKKQKPKGSVHWNPRVQSQFDVTEVISPDPKSFQEMRKNGFTTALVVPEKGVFRGKSALLQIGKGKPGELIVRKNIAQHFAFEYGGFRDRQYPGSLMGAIALMRQTLYDAQWYDKAWRAYQLNPVGQVPPETNLALEALKEVISRKVPVIFEVSDDLNFLRALKISREFGFNMIVKGSGYEYREVDKIRAANVPVILPINFPQKLDIKSPEEALNVSLEKLQHWEVAPQNPARLANAGIPIALTSSGLKKKSDFFARLRQAIENGLSEDQALAALTLNPAKILGVEKEFGSIAPGKVANLILADGNIFDKDTQILDVWVGGERFEITPVPAADPRGKWEVSLTLPDTTFEQIRLNIEGKYNQLKGSLEINGKKIPLKNVRLELQRLKLSFAGDSLGQSGIIFLNGKLTPGKIVGKGTLPDGRQFSWDAALKEPFKPHKKKPPTKKQEVEEALSKLALGAYFPQRLPEQPQYILIKNATLWTVSKSGILKNSDMLIRRGKIWKIGRDLKAPEGALIIDATGKHVTPGLIDAHSHTAISGGVNEGTQAVTAEVRVQDVINSRDISIYRELAGGLTVINQLHGSANPIGGQNSVIKLRWGSDPDGLRFLAAPPGIKFALGENVKQSNWGDQFTTRYPQTRMGVEQIIRDRFKAALDYRKQWEAYNRLSKKEKVRTIPPRKDLELETLLEILDGKRLVHSHSYRQDEILMLIRVADDFGFKIGTFQHVLEGYKIAEEIAKHGAGASTFSDWWAYKFEVYDAIPYNGALMDKVGVVVSYNSDSNELARRLNTEAAKAVKYGGLSPEEAIKFVTINPAKQLRIDDRVGSLEPGKDADFAIWNGDPLSTYTVCEQTWIDGRKYFDRAEDLKMRKAVERERNRLIQKYFRTQKKVPHNGEKSGKPMG